MNVSWLKDRLPRALRRPLGELRRRLDVKVIPRSDLSTFPAAQHTRAIFDARSIDCVIDVGANMGQFGAFLRKDVGYRGPIISFEPVTTTFQQLQAAAKEDAQWHVFRQALGAHAGALSINVTASAVFSSFLQPSDGKLFQGYNDVVRQEEVPVERLDAFMARSEIRAKHIFLKMDTQGFDREVLGGATGILPFVQAVQTELSFMPIYSGMPDYFEMLEELGTHGFVVSNMFPVCFTELRAIEFDCLLVREQPVQPGQHSTYAAIMEDRRTRPTSTAA